MLFDTDDNYVVLEMTGPDGKERRYELLDIVEFEGVAYGVFCPQEFPEDGDIILLHDIYDSSVDAALAIADNLTARGFTFVTVEQLAALRGASPQVGVKYHKFPAGG